MGISHPQKPSPVSLLKILNILEPLYIAASRDLIFEIFEQGIYQTYAAEF